jgi:predicted CxxxxCH...CXXCH cytochrome family protein
MPQVKIAKLLFVGLLTLTASFIGCSDPNTQSPFNADTGHAANWLPTAHMEAATSDLNSCGACHGANYSGGVSGVSCTSCHMGGVTNIHPAGWLGDACTNHGTFVLTSPSGTSGCSNAYCHGTNLGGVPESGPSCTKCHPTIPTSPSCGTCHGTPPNGLAPTGNVYPNLPGKHATHMALNGVTCAACHNRSCDQHMNGTVDVMFDAVYNAKSGTGSFNTTAKTCQEVSCHGGPRTQTLAQMEQNPPQYDLAQTPDWYTGSITVASQCQTCHIYGTTEYNSYLSGKHFFHRIHATCIDCHDTIKLTNPAIHFPNLSSPVISAGTASATTNSWLNYNGTTCTNANTGCHQGDTRNWWQ